MFRYGVRRSIDACRRVDGRGTERRTQPEWGEITGTLKTAILGKTRKKVAAASAHLILGPSASGKAKRAAADQIISGQCAPAPSKPMNPPPIPEVYISGVAFFSQRRQISAGTMIKVMLEQ
jgi:hypothetical protein